jgi:hypothetical protein
MDLMLLGLDQHLCTILHKHNVYRILVITHKFIKEEPVQDIVFPEIRPMKFKQ